MYTQNDGQMLMHRKITPSKHGTKSSLHLCQITSWHTTQGLGFFGVTPHLNYFLFCHCQHTLQFIDIVRVIALSKVLYVVQHFKNVTVCKIALEY